MNTIEITNIVKALNLPQDHFAIMGGCCLYLHDLRENVPNDIDIIADEVAWELALKNGIPQETNSKSGRVIKFNDDLIEVFDSWAPGEWDTKKLIDTAEIVDGIRFVNLENVLEWKLRMNRPKDIEDVEKIKKFLSTKSVSSHHN